MASAKSQEGDLGVELGTEWKPDNAGKSLAEMGKQYSVVSTAVLKRLDSLEHNLGDIRECVKTVENRILTGGTEELLHAKSELAQIHGLLERYACCNTVAAAMPHGVVCRFQFTQVDAVSTEGLGSGKEVAKQNRCLLQRSLQGSASAHTMLEGRS
jgi:hypothetical protein